MRLDIRNIRAILLFVFIFIFSFSFVSSATWVSNPNNCPEIFKSQQGIPGTKLCGYDGSSAYFYDMDTLVSPVMTTTFSGSSGSLRGGFGLDCEAKSGSSPFCLNSAVCNFDTDCRSSGRLTECLNWGISVCGNCGPGYQACDGSFIDGNGCEVETGVTSRGTNVVYGSDCSYQCSVGYLDCNSGGTGSDGACEVRVGVTSFSQPNTVYQTCTTATCANGWQACNGETATVNGCNTQTGSACTTGDGKPGTWVSGCLCQEVAAEHFITNTEAKGWGDTLLFGRQFNPIGWLMKLTSASGKTIGIDNESCIVFSDGSKQCVAGGGGSTTNETIISKINEYNISNINYIDNNYLKNSGDNGTGKFNFGGTWEEGGVTIDDGSLFAQRLFVFNITSLLISHLNVNGSIIPEFAGLFDLGAPRIPWRYGYFYEDVMIGKSSVGEWLYNQTEPANDYTDEKIIEASDSLKGYTDTGLNNLESYLMQQISPKIELNTLHLGEVVGVTQGKYSGNLNAFSQLGYLAGNMICANEYPSSHFCTSAEVLSSISGYFGQGIDGFPWFSNGPPGYTANANDCNGWRSDSTEYLGPFWDFGDRLSAGASFLAPCSQEKSLLCCGGTYEKNIIQ